MSCLEEATTCNNTADVYVAKCSFQWLKANYYQNVNVPLSVYTIFVLACIWVCHICVCGHVRICVCVCVCVCMVGIHTHVCVCVCVCAWWVYTHTHTHTHTHTDHTNNLATHSVHATQHYNNFTLMHTNSNGHALTHIWHKAAFIHSIRIH